jgi:hypothetical protein
MIFVCYSNTRPSIRDSGISIRIYSDKTWLSAPKTHRAALGASDQNSCFVTASGALRPYHGGRPVVLGECREEKVRLRTVVTLMPQVRFSQVSWCCIASSPLSVRPRRERLAYNRDLPGEQNSERRRQVAAVLDRPEERRNPTRFVPDYTGALILC